MKNFLIFLLLILLVFLNFKSASGESVDTQIWTPKNIMIGENYEGLVVLAEASRTGQMIVLSSSDPGIIEISSSVTVLPYSNHGIFSIKPLRTGEAQIFAVVDGKVISTDLFVYSSNKKPEGLKIVLPANSTKTDIIIGYVLSVDSKGSPAPVVKDTIVRMSATPMIEFESSKLQISGGEYYAKFIAKIRGSGKIFANSEDMIVAEHDITKVQDVVSVKVAVAPNIVMENSKAYFFIWLEKDGRPYKPPYVIHAFLSSSNLKAIRFTENPQIKQHSDAILKVSLIDGVGSGYLISQDSGSSVITAGVEGFGSTQTNVLVGPVLLDENFEFVESDGDDKLDQIESKKPNVAFAWFYPTITDSKAYGVIALYHTNFTQIATTMVSANSTDVALANKFNHVIPVSLDGRTITIASSEGLKHPNLLSLTESNEIFLKRGIGSTHAVQFEIAGINQGNYTLTVSGPGLMMFQSNLSIVAPFRDSYKLKLTPIPTILGTKNDLALISVVDSSGALIDAQKMFAGPLKVGVFANNEQTDLSISLLNSAVYSGILHRNTRVIVSATSFMPLEEKISPSGIGAAIMLDVPQRIHVTEPFPYTVHELDSYGVPIRKLNFTNISSTSGIISAGKYLRIDSIATENLAAVTNIGVDSRQIDSFANTFNFELISNGITNRINKDFELRLVSNIKDFQVVVDSPIPFAKIDDDTYLITPDKEGFHNITFTAIKPGYMPVRNSFTILVEKFVDLVVNTVASDGADLHINQIIELGNTSKIVVTPYHDEVKPEFIEINFPADVVVGNKGYRLEYVSFEDQKIIGGKIANLYLGKNTEIVASYQRMIKIDVENAQGTGFYPYGQTVVLSVPPKDKVFFLIRDVFDHWEGLEYASEYVAFAAVQDIKARAILREDYTFLMLSIAGVASVIFYNNLVRKRGLDISFYFEKFNMPNFDKIMRFLTKSKGRPTKIPDDDGF